MQRIGLGVVLAVSLALASFVGEAQEAGRVYRIGMLNLVESGPSHLADAFVEQLSKLGYVQGRNLTIERLFAGGAPVGSLSWQRSSSAAEWRSSS